MRERVINEIDLTIENQQIELFILIESNNRMILDSYNSRNLICSKQDISTDVKGREPVDVSNGLNCIRIYSNLVKQMISFETSPLVDCMIYSTMGLNNVCSFSHLNMPEVRMSDLRSVQFDICDGHGEVVSIASDISSTSD